MKDLSFSSNGKLFEEVERLKQVIRDEIYNKSRNLSQSPSLPAYEWTEASNNKSLRSTSS
jgi:hypothetical protein